MFYMLWDSNMSDLGWNVTKVNLDLWNFYLAIVLLGLINISSENNDFDFNSIQKSTFQKITHLNALGSKFDLDIK